jgi:hypothetical protein
LRQLLACRDEPRQRWRTAGYDFPRLVVVCVGRLGTNNLELWREDLDLKNLRVKVVNYVRAHPNLTPMEVSTALRAAYPRLRPGDLIRPIYEKPRVEADALDIPEARRLEIDLRRLN